jgi:presenilin-like A22 family membrane protease
MKTKKELDNFAKYIMKEAGTESPSQTFVSSVMDRVKQEVVTSQAPVYQPVISKQAWLFIIAIFVVVSVALLTGTSELSLDFLSIDFNMNSWLDKINFLSAIQITDLITISVFVFTVMVLLQLFFIMRYMSKKFQMA